MTDEMRSQFRNKENWILGEVNAERESKGEDKGDMQGPPDCRCPNLVGAKNQIFRMRNRIQRASRVPI